MFRKDSLRSVLSFLRCCGYNTRLNCGTCASSRTVTSQVFWSSRLHHTAGSRKYVRLDPQPNKNWKMITKSRLSKEEEVTNLNVAACEEGIEAVPHSTVMSLLQNCSSVEEQMGKLCSVLSLTKEDIENRKQFAQSLEDLLKPFFPGVHISLFGSSINGFGFKGCDCDIAVDIDGKFSNDDVEVVKSGIRVEFPTVADVRSGKVPLENLPHFPPRLLLRFVRRILREHLDDISPNILLIKARHPILRFYSKKYKLFCDFSFVKNSSLRNTRSIRLIGYLDERVVLLIKLLRYWGKNCGCIGDIEHFNSYSFSLLVVFFLQNTNPPILPAFSELLEKSVYLVDGKVADDEMMFNDLKKFTPSKNTQTLEELLKEFFFYYMFFDFSRVICPISSSCVSKMEMRARPLPFEFSTICIQDPFELKFNLAHSASDKYCRLFLKSVLEACKSYQKKELWSPNPDSKWGLPLLFDSPTEEEAGFFSVDTELHHLIEIPLKGAKTGTAEGSLLKASKAVIDFFEYGLLFKCYPLKTNTDMPIPKQDTEKCEKSILNIQCTAFHNVFSGRSNWRRLAVPSDVENRALEKEHLISLKVSENKDEAKRALFSFDCELLEFYKNDVPSLLVSLNFQKVGQPAVVVFLREYLPKFVQQSL